MIPHLAVQTLHSASNNCISWSVNGAALRYQGQAGPVDELVCNLRRRVSCVWKCLICSSSGRSGRVWVAGLTWQGERLCKEVLVVT